MVFFTRYKNTRKNRIDVCMANKCVLAIFHI